jgi:hypothetical protein
MPFIFHLPIFSFSFATLAMILFFAADAADAAADAAIFRLPPIYTPLFFRLMLIRQLSLSPFLSFDISTPFRRHFRRFHAAAIIFITAAITLIFIAFADADAAISRHFDAADYFISPPDERRLLPLTPCHFDY